MAYVGTTMKMKFRCLACTPCWCRESNSLFTLQMTSYFVLFGTHTKKSTGTEFFLCTLPHELKTCDWALTTSTKDYPWQRTQPSKIRGYGSRSVNGARFLRTKIHSKREKLPNTIVKDHRAAPFFQLSQTQITSPSLTADRKLTIVFNRSPKKAHLGQYRRRLYLSADKSFTLTSEERLVMSERLEK